LRCCATERTAKIHPTEPVPTGIANGKYGAGRAVPNAKLSDRGGCAALQQHSLVQAIEALRDELKLTPAECIAIEMEMATRIHQRPALAHAKFAKTAAAIAEIMPWFETFLELLRTGEKGEAA
jgi:hypothetical protein